MNSPRSREALLAGRVDPALAHLRLPEGWDPLPTLPGPATPADPPTPPPPAAPSFLGLSAAMREHLPPDATRLTDREETDLRAYLGIP